MIKLCDISMYRPQILSVQREHIIHKPLFLKCQHTSDTSKKENAYEKRTIYRSQPPENALLQKYFIVQNNFQGASTELLPRLHAFLIISMDVILQITVTKTWLYRAITSFIFSRNVFVRILSKKKKSKTFSA